MSRLFDDASSQKLTYSAMIGSPNPLTLSAWFRSDDATAIQNLIAFGRSSSDTPNLGLRLRGDVAGDPIDAYQRDNASVTYSAQTSSGYSINTWHHACGVFTNNSSRSAYLDGGNSGSNTAVVGTTTLDRTSIGALERLTPTQYMSGRIAEVAIWDVALTAAEVMILSKGYSPLLVRPESLVAYWPLIGRYSPEIDLVGGFGMTVTGATSEAHPRIIYQKRRVVQDVAAPAGHPAMRRWGMTSGGVLRPVGFGQDGVQVI